MENNLFMFIFNTLRKRVNDPNNKSFWLPGKLSSATKPNSSEMLIPLQETDWKLGSITGTSGSAITSNFVNQWALKLGHDKATKQEFVNHQVIPCPENPWVNLSFPVVTIGGLQNLLVLGDEEITGDQTGYITKITMQMDAYDEGILPRLSINGKYRILQSLCTAAKNQKDPLVYDGWQSIIIDGTGSLGVTFDNTYVDVTLHISIQGTDENRSLQVEVLNINIRGKKPPTANGEQQPTDGEAPLPTLNITHLTIDSAMWIADSVWLPAATNAIQSPDGQQGLFQQLNLSLNKSDNLVSLSGIFTDQVHDALDKVFGTIGVSGMPSDVGQQSANPVDQYLFDRVRVAVNKPDSDWFLPAFVYNAQNPSLEPLVINQIGIPDQKIGGLLFTQIQMTNLKLTGASNIIAPPDELHMGGNVIIATMNLATLNPPPLIKAGDGTTQQAPPPPLLAVGQFSMLPLGMKTPLTGAFTIKIASASINSTIHPVGTELDNLQLSFTSLLLDIKPEQMEIILDIQSALKSLVQTIINTPTIKGKIITEINDEISNKLSDISNEATKAVKKNIASRLEG